MHDVACEFVCCLCSKDVQKQLAQISVGARLDYQALFGKGAHAPAPNSSQGGT